MKRRGELTKIGALFEKYTKTLKPPQKTIERLACEIVTEVVGVVVLEHQVSYTVSTRALYIKTPALLRSEIRLKLPEIMAAFEQRLGAEQVPHDIIC